MRSLAVTGRPSVLNPTTISPSRRRRSARLLASDRIAMISEAAVMTKPVSRAGPPSRPPMPVTMRRSARSFMSMARGQRISRGSSRSSLPKCRCASSSAASRLWALVIAWKSPLKWRLILSTGASEAFPPPVAPPFCPKTGPSEGSRSAATALCPRLTSPWVKPMVLTVLPSPLVVGVIAVTRISLPRRVGKRSRASSRIFAVYRPYGSSRSSGRPSVAAISVIGRMGSPAAILPRPPVSRVRPVTEGPRLL